LGNEEGKIVGHGLLGAGSRERHSEHLVCCLCPQGSITTIIIIIIITKFLSRRESYVLGKTFEVTFEGGCIRSVVDFWYPTAHLL
jgi:hypothetical protein